MVIYMNETYNIVGVKYPSYYDRIQNRKVGPVIKIVNDKNEIKGAIEKLLFNDSIVERVNYVVVKWAGKMFTCDPVDVEKKQFVKTEITSHPYQEMA